jgi:hypothetical protein
MEAREQKSTGKPRETQMPIRRSVRAYRSATPFEQAGWTLAFVASAVAVPAMLRWLLWSLADSGAGRADYPATAARMAVAATAGLVQWVGIAILGGLAVLCAAMALSYARGRTSDGIPGWAVAETYAVGAAASLAGLVWMM